MAVAAALACGGAKAETMADAIALAYQTNPALLAQQATLRATDETWVQARAGYEPTASIQASVTTDDNSEIQNYITPGVGQNQSSTAVLTVNQPIYTGGRVARQIDAAEAGVLAGREGLRVTEETLIQNVVQAYVGVRCDQRNVQISNDNVALLESLYAEIKARFKVGDVTQTDVSQTLERVLGARAEAVAAVAALKVARATYAQVVGQMPGDLAPEPPVDNLIPKTADDAAATALVRNPQLRQALFTERESAAKLAAAKAQTRPTFSLQGSAGYAGSSLGVATPFGRPGYDFSASAVATMPITTGGVTSSQIRQEAELNTADRDNIEIARRQVLFDVAQSWHQLDGLRESLVFQKEQVDAAKIAFEGSRQESRVGLLATLDVLIAEEDLYGAQIALSDAERDVYNASSGLLSAVGTLQVAALTPQVPQYDPEKNFKHVTRLPFWTPYEPAIAAIDKAGAPGEAAPPAPIPKLP